MDSETQNKFLQLVQKITNFEKKFQDIQDFVGVLWSERTKKTRISAYASGTQTIRSSALVTFDTEKYDTKGEFANSVFTASTDGYYNISAYINCSGGTAAAGDLLAVSIKKNAVFIANDVIVIQTTTNAAIKIVKDVHLVPGDTISIYALMGAHNIVAAAGELLTSISIHSI